MTTSSVPSRMGGDARRARPAARGRCPAAGPGGRSAGRGRRKPPPPRRAWWPTTTVMGSMLEGLRPRAARARAAARPGPVQHLGARALHPRAAGRRRGSRACARGSSRIDVKSQRSGRRRGAAQAQDVRWRYTRSMNSSSSRIGIEVGVAARLGAAGRARRDRGAQGLERRRGVAGAGGGGGQAVEHVLVRGVDLGRLAQELERLVRTRRGCGGRRRGSADPRSPWAGTAACWPPRARARTGRGRSGPAPAASRSSGIGLDEGVEVVAPPSRSRACRGP